MSGDRVLAHRGIQQPNNTTIRYSVSGPRTGPTLVLIHGWACDRTDFDALTAFLPTEYRVIAVDLAEHGESRSGRSVWTIEEFARDVVAVVHAECVDRCVVVGHSMGGAVAVEVARLLPQAVSRVVALDALHYLFLFPAAHARQAEAIMQPFHDDFAAGVRAMVSAGSPPGFDPTLQEAYAVRMSGVRLPAGLLALRGLVDWDMDRALSEVSQPITVFAVAEMVSQDAIHRYGDRLDIVPIALGSHHFHVESPKGTAELLACAFAD